MRRFLIYSKSIKKQPLHLGGIIHLSNDYYLEFDTNLKVTRISNEIVILGVVVMNENYQRHLSNIDPKDPNLADAIYNVIKDWSGRWVLIFHNLIIGDPLNSLNMFYANTSDNFILSNSLGLFMSLGYSNNSNVYNPNSLDNINWNISPQTRLRNVYLLLPFEILDLSRGIATINRFLHTSKNKPTDIGIINQKAIDILKDYKKLDNQIYLTLTAGFDSRYLYAGLLASFIDFKNLLFVDKHIKKADIRISKVLSKSFGIKQKRIRKSSLRIVLRGISNWKRKRKIDKFDCFNCQEIDRDWFIHGMYCDSDESLLFRGNIGTEVFQGHKNYLYYEKGDGSSKSVVNSLRTKYPNLNNKQSEDIAYWWDYRINFIKESGIDWRLLFWLDQRCCAWAGAINSVFDLTGYHAVNPLNCDTLLEELYNHTNKGDIDNGYQKVFIQYLKPELNNYPYNPKTKRMVFLKRFK